MQLHQGVRFLRPSAVDAATAVVLETSPDQFYPVGKQCGGQGIPGKSLVRLVVKAKLQGAATVDAATGR